MLNIKALINWFEKEGRDLPWRKNKTPYRVWVSEVMLQQTTAKAVIPYFERWMERFPTIKELSSASLEEVIKLWEGLGYYSRARRLHSASKTIMKKYQGQLPNTYEELKEIEGLGPYTIAAIQSFAFYQKAAAIDGNVMRVVSRLKRIEEDMTTSRAKNEVYRNVLSYLPDKKPFVAMEAFIELGATICLKKPLCYRCPIKRSCEAFLHQKVDQYPRKKLSKKIISLSRDVFVIESGDFYLLKKERDTKKIMAGLYEFPYAEKIESLSFQEKLFACFSKRPQFFKELDSVVHYFTHYKVKLFPLHYKVLDKIEVQGFEWTHKEELNNLPFSSGHRKVLSSVM